MVITLLMVLIQCVDGFGTAGGRGKSAASAAVQNCGGCNMKEHFDAAFLLSFVDNS